MTDDRKRYPSDVCDEEWAFVAPYLTLLPEDAGQRDHSLREVFNGLRYIVKTGAPWRWMLNDLPPWPCVYQQARRWLAWGCFEALVDDLRAVLRMADGRGAEPSAAILDSRTLRSTPESGERAGYDGAKRKKGSKLHAAVDTLGNLLALHVTAADIDDRTAVAALSGAVEAATEGSVEKAWVDLGWGGLARHNLSVLTDRAGILAERLASRWGVVGRLADLPDLPLWTTNATCIETGKNWRFSKREMGDWSFGRHYSPPFGIAQAAAASAAVPYGIGALRFRLPSQGWMRTDPAIREPLEAKSPPSGTVHLWDGGAYENLGLEAIFKPGEPLRGCDYLVCSDASGPLGPPRGFIRPLLGGDLWSPRLFDVASDQIRALRSRMLVREYAAGRTEGVLVRMGNSTRDIDVAKRHRREPAAYDAFLTDADCRIALAYPTNLKAMPTRSFDMLVRHGRENADITLAHHGGASMSGG